MDRKQLFSYYALAWWLVMIVACFFTTAIRTRNWKEALKSLRSAWAFWLLFGFILWAIAPVIAAAM